jgi:hypothetical protein
MDKVKNQHYVPQFYLRKFAYPNDRLHVFDKFNKRSFQTNAKNIASETGFYDFHPDIQNKFQEKVAQGGVKKKDVPLLEKALDPQMIEHELAAREARFSPIFDEILYAIEHKKPITEEQRWYLTEFIVLQILRTPEYRKTLIETEEGLIRSLLRFYPDSEDIFVKYDDRRASIDHASFMFNPRLQLALTTTLIDHIWLFGENRTNNHFYTSDSPVVKRAHLPHPLYGVGYGSLGVQVAFPLTPKYMLIMCEKIAFHHIQHLDLTTISLNAENVIYYNSLQVFQSYRHVFCPHGEFLLAADISNAHPRVSVPERERVKWN